MDGQETQTRLERFHRDVLYYDAHHAELVQRYPEHWVAVFNEEVVGANTDSDRLFEDLKRKGVPLESVVIEFATTKDDILILPG